MKKFRKVPVMLLSFLMCFNMFSNVASAEGTGTGTTKAYKAGDVITLGKYEQDGDTKNGKEDIEWEVLSVKDGKILLISKYCLEKKKYDESFSSMTWENCSLRKWLNEDFYKDAFTSAEKSKIQTTKIVNKDNPDWETEGGNDTKDKIFCLSVDEVKKYYGTKYYTDSKNSMWNQRLLCAPTQKAKDQFCQYTTIGESDYNSLLKDKKYSKNVIGKTGGWWWLRSPGLSSSSACFVNEFGQYSYGDSISVDTTGLCVRPAMYIIDNNADASFTGVKTVDGKKYLYENGSIKKSAWVKDSSGKWYHSDKDGLVQTGWQKIGGKWYLFSSSGEMRTGWIQEGKKWYYFKSSGEMVTGWQKIGSKQFYFKSSGEMASGWVQIDKKWYKFKSSGEMQTGWVQDGKKWYYFSTSGIMMTGWQKIGSKQYYFGTTGEMATGWKKINGKWYYFETSGTMVTGSKKIGNKTYKFNSNGVCQNP